MFANIWRKKGKDDSFFTEELRWLFFMRSLPSFVLKRLRASQDRPVDHPDTDLLTAFAEGNLSPRERTSLLAHIAMCPNCRNMLALAATRSADPVLHSAANSRPAQAWRMAAAAAGVCMIVAGVWEISRPSRLLSTAEISKAQQTAAAKPSPPLFELPATKTSSPVKTAKLKAQPDRVAEGSYAMKSAQPAAPAAYGAAAKLADEPGQDIVVSNVPANPVQNVNGMAKSVGSVQFQKQAVLPNRLLPAAPAVARPNLFLPAPAALNRQTIWSLEGLPSDGTVKRSDDSGQTWQTITVDGATPLYAVSASGLSVWVGGDDGKLFHSDDGGMSWKPVQVFDQGQLVKDRIVEVDARGDSVKVKTVSGVTFVTDNGGARWKR